ncbi:uncharacterized protein EV422DRAFT_620711 [Fimicolochytrium jonesii]|uniref:uncharacterized protein n=1 Tax=Fimicolochytrium jonesii TaxID=1396493 RepID=UPI0022FF3885|nr:uncharacterized protein EV422DRAFT_620711 [Fimicolochytrium jonesii]KAI8819849.1 hypothetical protein EV422DRAFT_620711 [Fimicolochytrium jonesii]
MKTQKSMPPPPTSSPYHASRRRGLYPGILETPLDNLDPILYVREQRHALKVEEKKLLLRRWKHAWEDVRPAQPYWYELKTKQFNTELKKAFWLDELPGRADMEWDVRRELKDLHNRVIMEELSKELKRVQSNMGKVKAK